MKRQADEEGFVLIASMVMLLLLTVMSVGLYFRGNVNQQTSVSDRDATKGYYLCETALNYITYAIYSNSPTFNALSLDGDTDADRGELQSKTDQANNNTLGYFDVTALASRVIDFSAGTPPSPSLSIFNGPAPIPNPMGKIMPLHVTLAITTVDAAGSGSDSVSITPTWGSGLNAGKDLPGGDGAIVWITSADSSGIDSVDTSSDYTVIAYAVAYVNGKPVRMMRAQIGDVAAGFPSNLGAMTNGYQ